MVMSSWNTGHAYLKANAIACLDQLQASNTCGPKPRSRKSSSGSDNARCFCLYSVGVLVNIENFLSHEFGENFKGMRKKIDAGLFYGADNSEDDCNKPSSFVSLALSCASDSVLDRNQQCAAGIFSPEGNLYSKTKAILALTKTDTTAPCETRPPYCNRLPPNK